MNISDVRFPKRVFPLTAMRRALLCLFSSLVFLWTSPLAAQGGRETLGDATIRSRLEKIDASTVLNAVDKAAIHKRYESALSDRDLAVEEQKRADMFASMSQTVPEDIGSIRRELLRIENSEESPSPQSSLFEIETELAQHEKLLQHWTSELARLSAEPQHRASRRREIPDLQLAARREIDDLKKQRALNDKKDDSELVEAVAASLDAHELLLNTKSAVLDNELQAYEATIDLLPLQRDLASEYVSKLKREVKTWSSLAKRLRESEVDIQLQLATNAIETSAQPLKPRAVSIVDLVQRRIRLRSLFEEIDRNLRDALQVQTQLQLNRTRVENKVEAVGLTGAVGVMLRKQAASLPNARTFESNRAKRQAELLTLQFDVLEFEDRRSDLADLDLATERMALELKLAPALESRLQPEMRKLLLRERRNLDYLIADANNVVDQLFELEQVENRIIAETAELKFYINERVLWVRNANRISTSDLRFVGEAGATITNVPAWRRTAQRVLAGLRENFIGSFLILLLAVALAIVGYFGWPSRRTTNLGRSLHNTRNVVLLKELVTIVCGALWLPLLLWFAGDQLVESDDLFSRALGHGLWSIALMLLPLQILYQMNRPDGFAKRYMGWTSLGVKKFRFTIGWMILTLVPLTFVRTFLSSHNNVRWDDSFGRILLIVNILIVIFFIERLARPTNGILVQASRPLKVTWAKKFCWVLYLVGIGSHLALGFLAYWGYGYAAERLGYPMRSTAFLVSVFVIVGSLLLRWTHLNKRRLQFCKIAATRTPETAETPGGGIIDLRGDDRPSGWFIEQSSDGRMGSLITTLLLFGALAGLWVIWVDVTPAMNVVHRVNLWDTDVVSTETTSSVIDGAPVVKTITVREPVTLGNVLFIVFLLIGTFYATRYLGGVFELPFLERLPIDAALENTITSVTRYTFWIVAVFVSLATLGVTWGKVQWMAAALTLGLGFGMQEIFANFISGLILLFERPMRVGDVITIGDTTGVVRAIRTRATTITDWDRKELVVPNKEFTTGRLLNWTLSNKTNRRVIVVGVEYGSDPDLVRELLLRVAKENHRVLDTPAPIALMQEFGDSAMIFTLRVYHDKISHRLRGLHEINAAITRALSEAGIKVAFPQRDLHIRSSDPNISWFGPEETDQSSNDHASKVDESNDDGQQSF